MMYCKLMDFTIKKWYTLLTVAILLFTISGCDTTTDEKSSSNTDITFPTAEETEPTVPTLGNIDYWDVVHGEIVSMLNEHNLYVAAINSSYPCVLYEVEPGKQTDDGELVATGLSLEQYEELYQHVKEELHIILDKYKLAKPESVFHGCDSIVGIFFHNWFIDENKIYDNVMSRDVATYELDLLEYYHDHEENSYIYTDRFFTSLWSEYPVYMP